jgi:hypothetical protein
MIHLIGSARMLGISKTSSIAHFTKQRRLCRRQQSSIDHAMFRHQLTTAKPLIDIVQRAFQRSLPATTGHGVSIDKSTCPFVARESRQCGALQCTLLLQLVKSLGIGVRAGRSYSTAQAKIRARIEPARSRAKDSVSQRRLCFVKMERFEIDLRFETNHFNKRRALVPCIYFLFLFPRT